MNPTYNQYFSGWQCTNCRGCIWKDKIVAEKCCTAKEYDFKEKVNA
jgi:hypothetical protein